MNEQIAIEKTRIVFKVLKAVPNGAFKESNNEPDNDWEDIHTVLAEVSNDVAKKMIKSVSEIICSD